MSALTVRPEEEVMAGMGAAMVHSKALDSGGFGATMALLETMLDRCGRVSS